MPVRAPAISRSPGFAERLACDEELVAEICKRFEAARSKGRFPILSALLTETGLNFREPATIKVAGRDIKAAVLRDVDGRTNREIGERLGVPVPTDFRIKADHPTVRKMVRRGRKALKTAGKSKCKG